MNFLQRSELQTLAQTLLRSNNVELGDDPRTEIEVAKALGYLTVDNEINEEQG